MSDKPTLKDVALVAGVSEMTASRALRNVADVSDATRERITRTAAELGYVPNRIAGALASKSVNLVGVVVPSLSSFVFPEVLSGISEALSESDLQPVIGVSGYGLEEEEKVVREMLSWRPRGLIVAGLEHSEATRRMLKAAEIPIVEVMDVDGGPLDYCVGISHLEAGRLMAEAIVAKGYRNIGFIGTKMPFDFRAGKRLRGFTEGLEKHGIKPRTQELYEGSSSIAMGRELTALILKRAPDTECIYYSSDVMSMGGLMHCFAEGLSVPKDLALAGFNNLEALNGLPVQLATTNSFRYEIGQTAAGIILAKPEDQIRARQKTTVFNPVVLHGQSL
ncbi:MAG: LacI family DNA-binding transcriptional regulator [Rhodobacteraceae bacterium]|nr:LacI family DNA-binding transcriptional regulator [Paracoccaceae bacterium]